LSVTRRNASDGFKEAFIMVKLTLDQGNYLLRLSHNCVFPEKIGDRSFTHSQRATFAKEIRQLYKALKKVSPILQKDRQLYFGDREHYEEVAVKLTPGEDMTSDERSRFKVKKDEGTIEEGVELTGQAKNGAFRLIYLSTHPDSKYFMPPGAQEETVWPIAERLHCTAVLEEAIGLAKADTWEIKWDDEVKSGDDTKVMPKPKKEVLPEPAGSLKG
jgi:hypothetical protein